MNINTFEKRSNGVSIVIPVYNSETCIITCLKSLLAQTYLEYEIIIVNDGSTDNTLDVVSSFASSNDKIRIISKGNGGVSSARNLGIREARFDYLTFCDADDTVSPSWLQNMVENMEGVDLVAAGIEFIEGGGLRRYVRIPSHKEGYCPESTKELLDNLAQNEVFGFAWCKMFRTDIIKRNNIYFDETIHFREDELFTVAYIEKTSSWRTIQKADYFYILPYKPKIYHGSLTDFIYPIFEIYHRIFHDKFSPTLSQSYYQTVRNMIVTQILESESPSPSLINIFKYIVDAYPPIRSFSSILIDLLMMKPKLTHLTKQLLEWHR